VDEETVEEVGPVLDALESAADDRGEVVNAGDGEVAQAVFDVGPHALGGTFAAWLGERGWLRRFVVRERPGAMLRVLRPDEVRASDVVATDYRPDHAITVGFAFRAATVRQELLPRLLEADGLSGELRQRATRSLTDDPARRFADAA
jgi:hypothetical protein